MKYSLRSLMTFSIRDLFWLTIVVALVLGWIVDRQRQVLKQYEMEMSRNKFEALKFLFEQEGYTVDVTGEPAHQSLEVKGKGAEMKVLVPSPNSRRKTAKLPASSAPAPNPHTK